MEKVIVSNIKVYLSVPFSQFLMHTKFRGLYNPQNSILADSKLF